MGYLWVRFSHTIPIPGKGIHQPVKIWYFYKTHGESNTHGYLVFSYTKCILISEQIVTIQEARHLMTPTSSLKFPKQPPEDLP